MSANYFNTLSLRQQLAQLGKCRFMEREEFAYGTQALQSKRRGSPGGGEKRLKPPSPTPVAAQHIVVIGQMPIGQRRRPRWLWWELFDPGSGPVPEPAEPAAADGARRGVRRRGADRPEQIERVFLG